MRFDNKSGPSLVMGLTVYPRRLWEDRPTHAVHQQQTPLDL